MRAALQNLERAVSLDPKHKKAQKLLEKLQKQCTAAGDGADSKLPEPSLEIDIPIKVPLLRIHRFDIFTPEECVRIVTAAKKSTEWTSYGSLGATEDLTLMALPNDVYSMILARLYDVLFPRFASTTRLRMSR